MQEFRVILTHQHADFDALASLLGASLLFPDAIPVLPTTLNRDVQAYVNEYGAHFSFVPHNEVPRGRVTQAIVVDTQRANMTKGMDDETPHLIIDHHQRKDGLPETWEIHIDAVGANTTLLVERLIERRVKVTPLQATLLALGIYQDTGRLTYRATTSRDAQALSWLLATERRANLQVVTRFLHHPLSEDQQLLLRTLLANSTFQTINGHTIAIAEARVAGFDDEFSSLISSVQRTFDADAAFLLFNMVDRKPDHYVQLLARSRLNELDVGEIARYFGGNGHPRAAAAPVRELTLSEVRLRLEQMIEQQLHASDQSPVRTSDDFAENKLVRHIMSVGRPQTLSTEMTVAQALTLMRRYGHEGFPVVSEAAHRRKDGSLYVEDLLGLLTRRDVDRAFDHEMKDQPVTRFMHRGAVTARIEDPIAELRRQMVETGWGQIPVRNEQNEVIGIVTRTDLLRSTLEGVALHNDVVDLLSRMLTPFQTALLKLLGREAEAVGYNLYIVGGFVRDMLLDEQNGGRDGGTTASGDNNGMDIDIVMEGDATHFADIIRRSFGGRVVIHKRFRTAKWILRDEEHPIDWNGLAAELSLQDQAVSALDLPGHLDFVTARTEYYSAPSALPTVETSSIQLDLRRRDFTINTLAVSLNPPAWGRLLDFFSGAADLKEGYVRVLHSLSFVDDPTRILRAVRYEQRFDFVIHARTLELLRDSLSLIDRLSPIRIRHELDRTMQEAAPEQVLRRMEQLKILETIQPGLGCSDLLHKQFVDLRSYLGEEGVRSEEDGLAGAARHAVQQLLHKAPLEQLYWILFLAAADPDLDCSLADRLALTREQQRLLADYRGIDDTLRDLQQPGLSPSQTAQILDRRDPKVLALYMLIHSADEPLANIQNYLLYWRHVVPALNGHDIIRLGVPRGPQIHKILTQLRNERLDGFISTREDEERFVTKWCETPEEEE